MTFEEKLFRHVSDVMPNTTTRSFSRECGMSENYYCSIKGQGRQVSTIAILHLAEILEQREQLGQTRGSVASILILIADEVARRSQRVDSDSYLIQKIIASSVAKIALSKDHQYNLQSVYVGW